MLSSLDVEATRLWVAEAADRLAAAAGEIDALNVFPVADADTGQNMLATWRAVLDALEPVAATPALLLGAGAAGAVGAARGSSGTILAQALVGLARGLPQQAPALDGADLARGLELASQLATAAVAEPVDGTVLSVLRAASEAAGAVARDAGDLATVVEALADEAAAALSRTPGQLDVLARAGVVDAGGRGLLVVLEALREVVTGRVVALPPGGVPVVACPPQLRAASGTSTPPSFGYEVTYQLLAGPPLADQLRRRLAALGSAVVVAGDAGTWAVHAHVDEVGAAIEAGLELGTVRRISVTRLDEPAPAAAPAAPAAPAASPATAPGCALVVLTPGAGLARTFADAGAAVLRTDGRVPSVEEVRGCVPPGGTVVVLPNDEAARDAAEAAVRSLRAAGREATVLATRSPVQGLAAVAVHDPSRPVTDDVAAMAAAAGGTRYGELLVARERAQTSAGVCEPGDVLGLADGDVLVIADGVFDAATGLLDRLLIAGGELVTLVTGQGAPAELGERLAGYVRATRPAVDVVVLDGGQPLRPLLVGVE